MADLHPPPSPPPPDRDYYTIPAKSSWFRWDEIHEIEKSSLPEFFDSRSISRNPRAYKEYRDFIINKYREDPRKKLTFTEIRCSLVGDVGALHRVFSFLDGWGLVNFSVGGGKEVATDLAEEEEEEKEEERFPKVVVENGPPSGMKVVGQVGKASHGEKTTWKEGRKGFRLPPLTSHNDVFVNGKAQVAPVCGNCRERCVSGHYESKKENLISCTKCYQNENNKGLKLADDLKFVDYVDGNSEILNDEWSDIETLHLLEGIIAKKNDWALVSDNARRNKLDCIARLIQLPLGEHMLNTINFKYDGRNLIDQKGNKPIECFSNGLKEEIATIDSEHHMDIDGKEKLEEENVELPRKRKHMLSWPDATDSLMKQVANISTVAGPQVAAAAAEAAIMALCSESPYARKVFKMDDELASEFSVKPNGSSDPMDAEKPETEKQCKVTDSEPNLVKNFGNLTFKMRGAIATAFGSVAARAKMLADQEEREIEYLMATIVKMQVKKIHHKIKYFDEVESIMEKEYVQIQKLKESIISEWMGILQKANGAGVTNWRGKGFSRPDHTL